MDSEEPDYIITDTGIYRYERCWKEFRKYYSPKRIHILFVDEATFPDMNLFDYACVMNSHFSIDDRVCKIPNDFFYSNKIMLTSDNSLYGAGKQKCKEELEKKTGFCNFLYSNPNAHPNRDALFYSLNCYKNVDAIGSHLRNVGGENGDRAQQNWMESSVEQKSYYKFTIAAENAAFPGYTSEKLMTSFQAHSIPIYWGNRDVVDEFNPRAFINANQYASFDEVIDLVKKIDQDDDLWLEMIAQPWQTAEQKKRELDNIERYKLFTNFIFLQDFTDAFRAPRGTQVDAYVKHFFYEVEWVKPKLRQRLQKIIDRSYLTVKDVIKA